MKTLLYKFVELMPDSFEDGVLYISMEYCLVMHNCVCGCGKEVVTPISPTDWQLTFDGKSISLFPSIGNWNFECKSHYWITNNKVIMAKRWSKHEIDKGRKYDLERKKKYFKKI